MKKILVTGGAGFIGSNLIKHLLKEYKEVEKIVVLDNMFTGKEENKIDHKKVIYIESPTWDIDKFFSDKEGLFDTVFHFGEYSRIVKSFNDSQYVMKTNLHGTTCILEKCRKWGAKLIYSASSSKFGNDGKDENLSPYSWVKSKIVELIKNYNDWYNLQYEICYFFNVYGPGQITSGDYATVIGIFENQYLNGEAMTVVSPGTQTRDFTHVYDVVRGVGKAATIEMNKEWHLRSGKNISIIDVANLYSKGDWHLIPERRGERFTSEEFPSDTNKVLQWEPQESLEEWIGLIKECKQSGNKLDIRYF
jgi:UDP-glucose 4-epimerase